MIFNIVFGIWVLLFIVNGLSEYDINDGMFSYTKKDHERNKCVYTVSLAILITIMAIISKFI